MLRKVSREAHDAFRTHPDAPVRDLNVFEDVGNGELLLLALRSFAGVGGKGSDIDEPGDTVIGSCGRDDTSTVGVADQNGWAVDPPERPSYRGDIAFVRVEAILGGHYFVPLRLKRGDHLAKA